MDLISGLTVPYAQRLVGVFGGPVSIEQDAEDERHRYIALDIEASGQATEELLAGQRKRSAGLSRVCPSRHTVYFALGWR